ncbi:hypothetical protein GUITHDRAFT_71944 [Guillardia theta CCMP2712]|uniref:Uncharacterized protein n=1 Tax=Guillardia theta (strain CCMP2712) TaxID=905079 RepID=L1J8M4_GUITC|nr:hypothetical protein GUITHDRAFT_71944 [Guillardia theta CCMP2712]EKX44866.1 hypothetical protein GUITHDRAFT_71944 [Guillardia theta CCMP2712]|eukprot:XP_005831846.1 hypothetical protein GUITHDRAFT_71944 [Guillardia theta CCMP2712]
MFDLTHETDKLLALYRFSSTNAKWLEVQTSGNVPPALVNMSLVVVNEFAYHFGGASKSDYLTSNLMYKLNLKTFEWARISSTENVPLHRHGHGMVAVGTLIYVFGGAKYIYLQDLYTFNIVNNQWTVLNSTGGMPSSRAFFGMAAISNIIYVFGGEGTMPVDSSGQTKNDMYAFDTSSQSWADISQTGYRPQSRYGQAMAAVGTDIYLYGGSTGEDTNLYMLDVASYRWSIVAAAGAQPSARYKVGMAAIGNDLFLFGGYTKKNSGEAN